MVYFKQERFLVGAYSKLSRRKFRPFRILRKLGEYAHLINLPQDLQIFLVFNNVGIYMFYWDPPESPQLPFREVEHVDDMDIDDVGDMHTIETRHEYIGDILCVGEDNQL